VTTVTGLFRYPVKSMQGSAVSSLDLTADGFDGDRRWALVDAESGRLMSAKRWSALLQASADDDGMTLPDGGRVAFGDADADAVLSAWLGRPVRLVEAGSDADLSYEMTFDPPDDDAEYYAIEAPAGGLVDLAAAHLVAEPTLRGAAERYPDLDWDVRRFRPNVLVDGDLEPFAEDGWVGSTLRIGTAELGVGQATVRCAMPLRAQPGLERQAPLYAALEELHANHLGLYLDVVTPGRIEIGDEVTVA
jgi:uncharacterized protein YcbX